MIVKPDVDGYTKTRKHFENLPKYVKK